MKFLVVALCLTVAATAVLAEDRGLQKRGNWQKAKTIKKQSPTNRGYQVKTDNDGAARIRFGDGMHGRHPPSGSQARGRYRSGGGKSGDTKTKATKNSQIKPSQTKVLIISP